MRLRTVFILNAAVLVPFGIGSAVAPHLFLSLFGATLGPAGAYMMQYAGAWLIGMGLMTWFSRDAAESEAGRGIALALVVSVLGQLRGVLNVLGWMPVAIQPFFVAGLGCFLLAER